jgi:RNA-directed DNA polymerase
VQEVRIPKKHGGERVLGVPTVFDRVAQTVVKLTLEPELEKHFLPDSYGYRPKKSALDAVGVTRERCWKSDWVLEFDIQRLFDEIPHDLLMKAVQHHTSTRWVLLYIERWLCAPMQCQDGALEERSKGTPQGSSISPLLANLYLHYTFDTWMTRHYPELPWCRYSDDGLVHCRSEVEAQELLSALEERFQECGLRLHPEKTQIVYCKDDDRGGNYPRTSFDFLGYTFRPRRVARRDGTKRFVGFCPAVSKGALKSMRSVIRRSNVRRRSDMSLEEIASKFNPILRGWISYYGRYQASAMLPLLKYFNSALIRWAMDKYKRYRGRKVRASQFILRIAQRDPMFVHWQRGVITALV